MQFFGIGIHVLIAVFFAIHVVRTGQNMYWLAILFMFPLLGSLVYGIAIYLPSTRIQYGAKKVISVAGKILDPNRELREAREAFNYTPTAQNQMRLAAALLAAGQSQDSAQNYEACLQGPFAGDPAIRLGAAQANFACQRYDACIDHLHTLRERTPNYAPEVVSLLMARTLAAAGKEQDARSEFEFALQKYGSFDARAEYAIWAIGIGDKETALRLKLDLDQTINRWNKHNIELNAVMLGRLKNAFSM
ncbi:tetratricopeptide repeat protein [Undibacterium sp. RuRC25W]|uniref:tetratricopeptide repeat protein n=1 Tax=Undibacterium sp. RuRC25W TaxID=3413047 RepID=UPI003BF26181